MECEHARPPTAQVFVGRRHIGGFDVLKALDDDGILEQAMRWQPVDGQAFTPTRAEDIAAATAMPLHFRGPLLRRAEEMAKLSYNAGSSPKLGEFLKQALGALGGQILGIAEGCQKRR